MIGSAITAGVAAVAAGASVISHTITKKLMQVALDRKQPKMPQKAQNSMMGASNIDLSAVIDGNRAAVERLEQGVTQTAEIVSFDGTPLTGHFVACEQPRRILVAMHGWRSSWSNDFAAIADFWKQSGCSVLYAEQRGQNNSGGDYMGFGLLERYDCLEWVKWVNETVNPERLPIYLCGISMGATSVLMASGLALPDNVHGVMADCGFTSPEAIWRQVVEKNFRLSYKVRAATAEKICRQKIHMGANDVSTIDVLREGHLPVLFVHGSDDHFVPVEMTFENYKACAAPKRLLIVPGAEHGLSYFIDKESYEAASTAFWKDFD
ncbi:MAG: alpha/beta hydrolase [Clostridia bacterium]|nr:alpha/beta hydrolase [Clostridia bacterium]